MREFTRINSEGTCGNKKGNPDIVSLVLVSLLGVLLIAGVFFFSNVMYKDTNTLTGFATLGEPNTIYIDPTYNVANGASDGTIEHPYVAWTQVTFQNNRRYLQKRGTMYTSSSKILLYLRSNVSVGAYGSGERPIFNYTGSQHNYSFQFNQCTDCSIENMRLTAPSSSGLIAIIGMGSDSGGFLGGTRISVIGCEVWRAGSDSSEAMGIRAGGNSVKILNTTIHDISIDGIFARDTPGIEIGYSNIYNINRRYFSSAIETDSSGDGIQLNGIYDGFHIHHTIINRTNGAGNKFSLILNSAEGVSDNAGGILEYNTFVNDASIVWAVHIERGNGIITRYNTFMGVTEGLRIAGQYTSNNLIHNNIFYGCTKGVGFGFAAHPGVDKIYNNVFYNFTGYNTVNGVPYPPFHVWVQQGANVEMKNNIHLRGNDVAVALYKWGGLGNVTITNSLFGNTETAGASGTGTNAVIGNPLFVNAAAKDFHLQSNSPAINNGTTVGILFDRDGVSVPQNGVPDIGAYEYVGSGSSQFGNITVTAGAGGTALGSASNFVVPAVRSVSAIASSGYSFGTWTKVSGDCVVNSPSSSSATVSVNSGWCYVQANFAYVGGTVANGGICTGDINCSSGNCDADFSGVMRCHATASSCVVNSTGAEILSSAGSCSNQYQYKTCNNGVWSSTINVTTGYVCRSGNSVVSSGNMNCGTGAQSCSCAVYRNCVVGSCVASEYYVGFAAGGVCTSTSWQSKGTIWNVTGGYRISANSNSASCTVVNTGGVSSYSSCSNQYTRTGFTGYCNGLGSNATSSLAVSVGTVCRAGSSVVASGASNCGTGAQSCSCSVWRDCVVGSCVASEYYVGFAAGGVCTSTSWQSKGTIWNVTGGYRIGVASQGTSCTTVNTGGVLNYNSCSNQYTRTGVTGYCNGISGNQTTSIAVALGKVCRTGAEISPGGEANCGTGSQNCFCANDWKQCDSANACTHDVHYVGFASSALCSNVGSVERVANVANTDTYECVAPSNATSCVNMCGALFDTNACLGLASYCSAGSCEGLLESGDVCLDDADCSGGNCDFDFSGVKRCHGDSSACIVSEEGLEVLNGSSWCVNQYLLKDCSNSLWLGAQNVSAGKVCQNGLEVAPSGAFNCGSGSQACYCANSYYQCDFVNDCTYDQYYVGFSSFGNGECDATSAVLRIENVAVPDQFRCMVGSNQVYALNSSVFDSDSCDGGLGSCISGTCLQSSINHAPLIFNQSFELESGSENGVVVGVVVAGDEDVGQNLSYYIFSANISDNTNNAFVIDEASGVLLVNNDSMIDDDLVSYFVLSVGVVDDGVPSLGANSSVIIDIISAPVDDGERPHRGGRNTFIPRQANESNISNVTVPDLIMNSGEMGDLENEDLEKEGLVENQINSPENLGSDVLSGGNLVPSLADAKDFRTRSSMSLFLKGYLPWLVFVSGLIAMLFTIMIYLRKHN
ncbi:MAG: choice-of-anchor Q domain-containing protein [Candidatus Nanoarchaeia archaeon]